MFRYYYIIHYTRLIETLFSTFKLSFFVVVTFTSKRTHIHKTCSPSPYLDTLYLIYDIDNGQKRCLLIKLVNVKFIVIFYFCCCFCL